ncbi:ATP-citrate synthase alpha chain protein 3-like [Camellia sinensis]|uniref:ATP-citrate synthase alpha chain protein 3-like n=1 Tax=Camellia sinensis TaxID=4442 RepID=UPI001035C007|nr:ATP-citrate synthase alpha chain protein 3-like [Camellia sinensis]XP_028055392.1 ATP-citrate synthase alpha chain protein 3-like [Camellia sinensis]
MQQCLHQPDLDFSFLEMNPFTLVNGEPYPLDMRAELDDTAAFKNFKKWGVIEFPLPFGRVLSPTESFIHSLDEKVIVASGAVKHEDLVEQVKKLFTKLSSDPTTTSELVAKGPAIFSDFLC